LFAKKRIAGNRQWTRFLNLPVQCSRRRRRSCVCHQKGPARGGGPANSKVGLAPKGDIARPRQIRSERSVIERKGIVSHRSQNGHGRCRPTKNICRRCRTAAHQFPARSDSRTSWAIRTRDAGEMACMIGGSNQIRSPRTDGRFAIAPKGHLPGVGVLIGASMKRGARCAYIRELMVLRPEEQKCAFAQVFIGS